MGFMVSIRAPVREFSVTLRRATPGVSRGVLPAGRRFCQVYTTSMGRFGPSLLSASGSGTVTGPPVQGRLTAARTTRPVWSDGTTTIETLMTQKRADTAVIQPANALIPRLKTRASALRFL